MALWHLDGNLSDSSSNTYTATLNVVSGDPAYSTNVPAGGGSNSLQFNGTGGYVSSNIGNEIAGNTNFTFSFWIKYTATLDRQWAVFVGNPTTDVGLHWLISGSGDASPLYAQFGFWAGTQNNFNFAPYQNQWTKVETVYYAAAKRMSTYINGQLAHTATGTTTPNLPSNTFVGIGYKPIPVESYFNGSLDEVQIQDCPQYMLVTSTADTGIGSLRDAVANVCSGGTITFDPSLAGQTIILASELVINKNLTIDGGTNAITISGNGVTRVFNVTSGEATLAHLAIYRGKVAGASAQGGGIYVNVGAILHLQYVELRDNAALGDDGTAATLSGVAYGGGVYNAGTLSVQNSTLRGNVAGGGSTYYEFDGNGGDGKGGALYNTGTLTLQNSTLYSNAAWGGDANRYEQNYGSDNGGNGAGGGVYNAGTLTVQNSTFSGNQGTGGWGGPSGGSAGQSIGGGLATYNSATIQNTTFADNASLQGVGIYNAGTWNLVNSLLVSQTANPDCVNAGSPATTAKNNLPKTATCPGATVTTTPRLGALADNGGGPKTHALLIGSPALDAGDATTCASLPGGDLDQRGVARHDGNADGTATCDIGAYEAGTMQCSVSSGNDYTFSSQSNVALHVNATTDLACLYVEELPINHPNATGTTNGQALRTGKYWLIEGLQNDQATTATGFNVNLTLPYSSASATTRVCKWLNGAGFGWDCAVDSYNINTSVTRNGLTSLSQWAVGDIVGPTAMTLTDLSAASQPIELPDLSALAIGALLMAGLGGWWFARRVLKFH